MGAQGHASSIPVEVHEQYKQRLVSTQKQKTRPVFNSARMRVFADIETSDMQTIISAILKVERTRRMHVRSSK